ISSSRRCRLSRCCQSPMATRSKLLPSAGTQPPPKSPLSRKRRSHQINDSPSAQRTSPKPASPGPSLRRSKRRCVVLGSFQSRLDSTRQCSLCAEALTGELASPESCPGHNFHLICLNNWLDLQQKSGAGPRRLACPMEACKRAFTTIFIRREVGGKVIQQLPADRSFACPICQETIVGECASPDCCDHSYCPACLRQWSRSSATCPLDRLPFDSIRIWPRIGSRRLLRTIRVGNTNTNSTTHSSNNRQQQQQPVLTAAAAAAAQYSGLLVDQHQHRRPLRRHATVDSAGVAAATADEPSPALPLDVNSLLGYLRFMSIRRLADGDFYGYCFYSSLLRII
ncbi:hypothetical protein BOX15_Mlig022491g2, partial [Macrostomum lignano]